MAKAHFVIGASSSPLLAQNPLHKRTDSPWNSPSSSVQRMSRRRLFAEKGYLEGPKYEV